MLPWRLGGAVALAVSLAAIGWQVWRAVDNQAWSDRLVVAALSGAALAALCVLVWTGVVTQNARRLVGPAVRDDLPDPRRAVLLWVPSLTFLGIAVGVVAAVGARVSGVADPRASPAPLIGAVVALLFAIPLTSLPLRYLADVVRQVGNQGVRVAQWIGLPALLSAVGAGSIVMLGLGGDGGGTAVGGWEPRWFVGLAAAIPSAVLIVVGWRAAGAVEEALVVAERRRTGAPVARRFLRRPTHPSADVVRRGRVDIVPGADSLRLAIVTVVAALALLLVVGAGVLLLFRLEGGDASLLPAERQRLIAAREVLQALGSVVVVVLAAATSLWSFVAVLNVRRASARRRNPGFAALAWPVSGGLVWILADSLVVGEPARTNLLGFALQAVVLLVPFVCLERAAAAVQAPRTAGRVTYLATVGLVVYFQVVIELARLDDPVVTVDELVQLAGFLTVGALLLLISTLVVTSACRGLDAATDRVVEVHNALVEQREGIEQRTIARADVSSMVPDMHPTAASPGDGSLPRP
jgi:hypothetical protein